MWYLQTTHHASASKRSTAHRVSADEAVPFDKLNPDDDEIMYML